jgi:flagellar motor switch/type III secretory pathway protein FliN
MLVREWLPHEAAANPKLGNAVGPIIKAWSERWFAAGGLQLGRVRPFRPGRAAPKLDEPLSAAGDFVHIAILAAGRLSSLALDPHAGDRASSAADVRILRKFAHRMAQDLASFVEARLKAKTQGALDARDLETYGGATFVLADAAGGEVLALAIPITALARALKSELGAARERSPPLVSLAQALRPTPVRVHIELGQAHVTMGDAQTLARGDVLILNTSLDDGAALCIEGAQAPFARGALREKDGSVLLDLKPGN